MAAEPVAKPRRRNSRGSRSGCSTRKDHIAQPTRPPAAAANPPTLKGLSQPRSLPSMIPKTRPPMPTPDSTEPTTSRRAWCGSAVLGASTAAATNATPASAAAATKVETQENCSSRAPERSMPRIDPETAKPDQIPTARARSSDGNTAVIVDKVPGMIIAAPSPMTARATMRTEAELAAAPTAAPAPNTTVPASSTLRRPRRSPSAPIGSTRAASATV